jgi:hypothetical protein
MDNGKDYDYGQKTKGLQHRTPDSVATDQRFKFDDYDREIADYEADGWDGEHRQHDEQPSNMHDDD